ncbi:hypothetical protein BV392_08930 [Rhodovulum sulfidophilum]|nr:hypothetical protein BV392_08930 [Rhodovulum sulfidophilum]
MESGAAEFNVILVYDVSRWGRFGSLARAYEMIGYRSDREQERIALNKRLRGMHPEIIART